VRKLDLALYRYPVIFGLVAGVSVLVLNTLTTGVTSITWKLCGPDPCPPNPEIEYGPFLDIQVGDAAIAILVGLVTLLVAVAVSRSARRRSEGSPG
jgi:multisubunit Na+/H+ antiporter MnhB subunit